LFLLVSLEPTRNRRSDVQKTGLGYSEDKCASDGYILNYKTNKIFTSEGGQNALTGAA
jgi:hypothetical protein